MSAQPMPGVEMSHEDPSPYRRIELAVATRQESDDLVGMLSGMMAMPWRRYTWLGNGHTYSWEGDTPGAVLLLANPPPARNRGGLFRRGEPLPVPSLPSFADRSGDPVTYLWAVRITLDEQEYASENGSEQLTEKLAREGRGWLWV